MPESITLVIEGQPFRAMLAEHDRNLANRMRQGRRP